MLTSSPDSSQRISDILSILADIRRRNPRSFEGIREARIDACKTIAKRKGINEESVRDKCWRQLDLPTVEDFDRLVDDWLTNNGNQLEQRLSERISTRMSEGDRISIQKFFETGDLPNDARQWWWVNQNKTYKFEREGGYIWAPEKRRDGFPAHHHANVARVRAGDVIFHYFKQQVCAVSVAQSDAFKQTKPDELGKEQWQTDGYMVRVDYRDLSPQIPREEIPSTIRIASSGDGNSPFTQGGSVNTGYLFSLSPRFVRAFIQKFPQIQEMGIAPPTIDIGTDVEAAFAEFSELLRKLNVNRDYGAIKLYKPAILLAVLRAIASGELSENRITFDWLVPRFVAVLAEYGIDAGTSQAQEAFFRLNRDKVWNFRPKDNQQALDQSGDPAVLRKTTDHAYFEDRFWRVLQNNELLLSLQNELITHWFSTPPNFESIPEFSYDPATKNLLASLNETGFHFQPWQVACYVTALRTKPFVILAGVSGSGKSQLPQLVATATGAHTNVIPVRPDWTDSSDVLGYVQLKGRLRPGLFLELARKALESPRHQFIAIIDEMNLARVEHYFAEILSRLEEGRSTGALRRPLLGLSLDDEDVEWQEVTLPHNLSIVGTVNMDETTHGFSRKVLDRAFTIEFSELDLSRWEGEPAHKSIEPQIWPAEAWQPRATRLSELTDLSEEERRDIQRVVNILIDLNEMLMQAQIQLAYRSRDEIALFVLHARDIADSFTDYSGQRVDPLDLAIQMKVLPRIAGGSGAIRKLVLELLGWSNSRSRFKHEDDATKVLEEWMDLRKPLSMPKADFPRTCARLCLMWDRIVHEGYTSFWL